MLTSGSIILSGFGASLATGVATGVGALPLFLVRKLSARLEDVFLAFAAGVMLAAAFFSLIIPASMSPRRARHRTRAAGGDRSTGAGRRRDAADPLSRAARAHGARARRAAGDSCGASGCS